MRLHPGIKFADDQIDFFAVFIPLSDHVVGSFLSIERRIRFSGEKYFGEFCAMKSREKPLVRRGFSLYNLNK